MIKPIVLYGEEILRKPTLPYKVGIDLSETIQDLFDTMYNAKGAGLAGPQINLSERIFVVDPPYVDFKRVFINPTILTYSGKAMAMSEGCLSVPNIEGEVVRASTIWIEWYDEKWEYHKEEFEGIKSRVIQHEYDHLDGILWMDRIDPGQGIKLIKNLKNISERNIEVTYPFI